MQRHAAGGAFAVEAGALGIASGGGKPLPDAVRGKMENALGADFSGVRVHVGPQAERIGAIAFTTGNDIYFAPGRYQPETLQGQQLLGHELTHVVQQRAGRVRNPLGSGLAVVQDRALEAEADRLGQRAATHRVAVQAKFAPSTVQPSAPVRISPPVSTGSGSYRLSAGAGGREIGSVMVHARERGAVEVTDLGVDAAQRGNGVGQMLVAAAARTGMQSGRSKVTLAAQDRGSGHLTRWYKEMGFAQTGVNRHGYPQFEAPISRVLAGVAQRREVHNGNAIGPTMRTTLPARLAGDWTNRREPPLAGAAFISPSRAVATGTVQSMKAKPRTLWKPAGQVVQKMEMETEKHGYAETHPHFADYEDNEVFTFEDQGYWSEDEDVENLNPTEKISFFHATTKTTGDRMIVTQTKKNKTYYKERLQEKGKGEYGGGFYCTKNLDLAVKIAKYYKENDPDKTKQGVDWCVLEFSISRKKFAGCSVIEVREGDYAEHKASTFGKTESSGFDIMRGTIKDKKTEGRQYKFEGDALSVLSNKADRKKIVAKI